MEIAKDSKRNKEIQIILIILSAQVEHNTQEGFQQFFITFSPPDSSPSSTTAAIVDFALTSPGSPEWAVFVKNG